MVRGRGSKKQTVSYIGKKKYVLKKGQLRGTEGREQLELILKEKVIKM